MFLLKKVTDVYKISFTIISCELDMCSDGLLRIIVAKLAVTISKAFKFNEIKIRNAGFTTPYQVGLTNKPQSDVGLPETV